MRFVLFSKTPILVLGPIHPPIEWVAGTLSLVVECPAVKVLTQLHLVSRLRIRGVVPPSTILLNDVHSYSFIFTDYSASVGFDFLPGDELFRKGFSRFLQISWSNCSDFLTQFNLLVFISQPTISAIHNSLAITQFVFLINSR